MKIKVCLKNISKLRTAMKNELKTLENYKFLWTSVFWRELKFIALYWQYNMHQSKAAHTCLYILISLCQVLLKRLELHLSGLAFECVSLTQFLPYVKLGHRPLASVRLALGPYEKNDIHTGFKILLWEFNFYYSPHHSKVSGNWIKEFSLPPSFTWW